MSYNKHINTFSTETDYDNYIWSSQAEIPNVGYVTSGNTVHYVNQDFNDFVLYGTYDPASYTGETFTFGSPYTVTIHFNANEGIFYSTNEDVPSTKLQRLLGAFKNKTYFTSFKKWKIDTSEVITLNTFLYGASNITHFDFSYFNTSAVTNMNSMLRGVSMTSVDLSSFDTTSLEDMNYMFTSSNITKIVLSQSFFNSISLTTYDFSSAEYWTDAESLATLVDVIPVISSTKTIKFSSNTNNALTTEQKNIITGKGWTITT